MAKTKSGKKSRILIIEDDGAQADAMAETLRRVGHDCVIVTAPRRALDIIKRGGFDLVLTDLKMGEIDGMEILRASKRDMPDVDVIMVTGYGTIHSAVEAMKQGASDYITKPLNVDELRECVARGIERRRAVVQEEEQTGGGIERFGFGGIIGNDPGLLHVISTARQIARTSATILIQGESGTGKELLARAIHNNSPRKSKNFVALNCAALSEGILESELFGHEKGAFTGALASRQGRFEYADGGTLFLDEVGDMPAPTQIKLLRVLEDGEIMRVGSNKPIRVDVRLLSATHADLEKLIDEGKFREDLYFRLKGVTLSLPPLRERGEDIRLLTDHFIKIFSQKHNRGVKGITPGAQEMLDKFYWPGNVRQLRNIVETIAILATSEMIDVADIPDEISSSSEAGGETLQQATSLEGAERELIKNALARAGGNREKTARILGIGQRTLYRKLKQYGLG